MLLVLIQKKSSVTSITLTSLCLFNLMVLYLVFLLIKPILLAPTFPANLLSDSDAPDPCTLLLSNPVSSIIIFANEFHWVLHSLKTNKTSGLDGIPPRCLVMNKRMFFVIFFAQFLILEFILLLGSMHLFNLFLRRVTAPTPPTIALLLSLQLLLKSLELC